MQKDTLSSAIDSLRTGGVGVMPTDTVYGIVAAAGNEQAARRLYDLKQRKHKPGTIIAADIDQLVTLGIKRRYLSAVSQYWPNAISIVLPCDTPYLHAGVQTIAVRIPGDTALRELLQQTGPLLTSSANQPGQSPATTAAEAYAYFGDTVDFYVEGELRAARQASTIIRVIDDTVEVLREGAVSINKKGEIV